MTQDEIRPLLEAHPGLKNVALVTRGGFKAKVKTLLAQYPTWSEDVAKLIAATLAKDLDRLVIVEAGPVQLSRAVHVSQTPQGEVVVQFPEWLQAAWTALDLAKSEAAERRRVEAIEKYDGFVSWYMQKLLQCLAENGKSPADLRFVVHRDGAYADSWERFREQVQLWESANAPHSPRGLGSYQFVGSDWWVIEEPHDDPDGWVFLRRPTYPADAAPLTADVFDNYH